MPTGSDRMRIVSQEAAYWYIRWTDDVRMPRDDEREFMDWIKQSPENIAEFLRMLEMDGVIARQKLNEQISKIDQKLTRGSKVVQAEFGKVVKGDFGNGVSQHDYQPCKSVSDKVPRKRKPWLMRLAASVGAIGVASWLGFAAIHQTNKDVVETAAAQWQHMTVPDGSNVHMDARTSLKVKMTPERRIIHLYSGQAVFDVVGDPKRPFTVRTPVVDVTAVGTRFSVKVDESGAVTTIVEEGVVEVTARDREDGAAVQLHPGEELRVTKAKTPQLSEARKSKVDARQKLEWTTGWISVYGATVGDLVSEFNRRHEIQIRIDDPTLAARTIDFGRIKIDSVDSFVRVMKSQGKVEVTKEGSVIRLKQSARSE